MRAEHARGNAPVHRQTDSRVRDSETESAPPLAVCLHSVLSTLAGFASRMHIELSLILSLSLSLSPFSLTFTLCARL